jgi:hypothetical protein
MNRPANTDASNTIAQAFGSDCVVVPIAAILPVKAIEKTAKSSHKYRQIAASIREIGLVEPPVVIQDSRDANSYLLLDGHLRIEVLRDLGQTEVECLVSTDDEAFTYNKRISRLSPVQEQRMIAKAIERNVPRDKIARALDINVRSVARKVQLLDGICHEAIGLLKDKICPMAVFDVLRKMSPLRQIEAAELLINANNFSVSYASAILAGTPQAHRMDHDWRLLSLKLIDGTDARAWQSLLKLEDLRIVGSDDQNVLQPDDGLLPRAVNPACLAAENFIDEPFNLVCLFRRRILIARAGGRPARGHRPQRC